MSATRVRVIRNGRVSIPAVVRRRWGTATVLVIDRGDYAIIRPVPDDPIGSLRGSHAGLGPASEEVRSADRAAEASSEERQP
jgi:bifunctional DNA-binding transcriptional regulator/antitoxin component of YhaV-PrlF toxin-antitoxin module